MSPSLPRDFSKLMFQGKVERAIRLLSDKEEKGLLGLGLKLSRNQCGTF